jgi:hypothetical protein
VRPFVFELHLPNACLTFGQPENIFILTFAHDTPDVDRGGTILALGIRRFTG